ncbi:Glycosyl hydrolase, BNR repeat protein [Myxococcus hansupus]|uniref:Glycosyl hydrolase, BNR repeat protein n=1 Tax=Pseudomyxococcus hansupus TaxID=1297742 RepID=A0A0H4XHV5_9BACT|nr:YCF48-related protein [Myxococcus hansupus]AKQ67837.1 Glycosyl hydrolase, BNR repeat protein [Myxococcus hansupus]
MQRGVWVSLLAGVLLSLSRAEAASPLPSVDLGVRELDVWSVSLTSRRTDADWWALARMNSDFEKGLLRSPLRVFRSADAGRSWHADVEATAAVENALEPPGEPQEPSSSATIDFLVWYTPEIGLMAGSIGANVLRTTDGGLTWNHVALPLADALWVYDLERAAGRTWICGSSRNIFRSDDAGATWIELRETPFSSNDRCVDMSFQDAERGWAAGVKGFLWATEDGGTTWRRLEPSGQMPEKPRSRERVAVMGDDTVVRVNRGLLSTYVSERLVRTSPLTTAGSGVLVPLDGLGPRRQDTGFGWKRDSWFGWKEGQIVLSHDQGLSWFVVGRVPEAPLRTLAITKDGKLFAQTQAEKLFVSMDRGRTWKRSTAWLDAYDFAVATGASPEGLESPLHCLLTTPEAAVKVRFDIMGCFGGTESQLELDLSKNHVLLSGHSDAGEKALKVRSRKLPRDEGLRILRALVNAATQQETPPGCYSTIQYKTVIEWSCSPKESWRRTVAFDASDCGQIARVDLAGGATPLSYARSLGVYKVASHALEGAAR